MIIQQGNSDEWKELMEATSNIIVEKYKVLFAGLSRIDGYPLIMHQNYVMSKYNPTSIIEIKHQEIKNIKEDVVYKIVLSKDEAKRIKEDEWT